MLVPVVHVSLRMENDDGVTGAEDAGPSGREPKKVLKRLAGGSTEVDSHDDVGLCALSERLESLVDQVKSEPARESHQYPQPCRALVAQQVIQRLLDAVTARQLHA